MDVKVALCKVSYGRPFRMGAHCARDSTTPIIPHISGGVERVPGRYASHYFLKNLFPQSLHLQLTLRKAEADISKRLDANTATAIQSATGRARST